jgi:cyclopropane fatty-acyl-phospholipid synthase-like methyltransferase
MDFFDYPENVEEYIRMAEGYNGRELIAILHRYLLPGASVLELGMGPGKDIELLQAHYTVTGSDSSQVFIDRYLQNHPDADVLLLDAAKLRTERHFDAIYSNKVLHHLTKEQLRQSFARQRNILNKGGIILHSFWYGDKEEEFNGLRFVYYTEETIYTVVGDGFELIQLERYTEIDENDSFFIVLRLKA